MTNLPYDVLILIAVICAIISALLFRRSNDIEKAFHFYVFTKAFFEILASILALTISNNLVGLHIFTLVQFIVLTIFFKRAFDYFGIKFQMKAALALGSVAIVLNSIFLEPTDTFNSNSRILVELYLILISLSLFTFLIRSRNRSRQQMQPSASFISAVFLEASVSFIFYLYSNKIIELDTYYGYSIFYIRLALNYLVLFIIFFGLIQIYKRGKARQKPLSVRNE